ncbi:hypothetical protein MBLNU230_g3908t1 [Neophaeotheca triangularis]
MSRKQQALRDAHEARTKKGKSPQTPTSEPAKSTTRRKRNPAKRLEQPEITTPDEGGEMPARTAIASAKVKNGIAKTAAKEDSTVSSTGPAKRKRSIPAYEIPDQEPTTPGEAAGSELSSANPTAGPKKRRLEEPAEESMASSYSQGSQRVSASTSSRPDSTTPHTELSAAAANPPSDNSVKPHQPKPLAEKPARRNNKTNFSTEIGSLYLAYLQTLQTMMRLESSNVGVYAAVVAALREPVRLLEERFGEAWCTTFELGKLGVEGEVVGGLGRIMDARIQKEERKDEGPRVEGEGGEEDV